MIKGFRHTGIVVSNIKKSLNFYQEILGLEIIVDIREDNSYINNVCNINISNARTIKLGKNGLIFLELLYFNPTSIGSKYKLNDIGCSHIAFGVNNINDCYKKLLNNKIIVLSEPKLSPNKFAKIVFCEDPDGVKIEFVEEMPKE